MNQTEVSRTSYDAPVRKKLIEEILTLTESECEETVNYLRLHISDIFSETQETKKSGE